VCLNWGCIPTKALLQSAEVLENLRHARNYGLKVGDPEVDFPAIIRRSRRVAKALSQGVAFLMKKNRVAVLNGRGSLKTDRVVEVELADGGRRLLQAQRGIILAVGARARELPSVPFDGQRILRAREAMNLSSQPKRLIIIGAGAIGVEFAYLYHTLGTEVVLLEMLPRILPTMDETLATELARSFKKRGLTVLPGHRVTAVNVSEKDVSVTAAGEKGEQTFTGDAVLVAIGVQANLENLGLDTVGVTVERNWIKVDEYLRTSVPGVYAIGDVVGPPWLAHVASHEGIVAVEHLAGAEPHPVNYRNVPACIYCRPQVASVGLSEEAAREAGYDVVTGVFPFQASGRARAAGDMEGLVKVVAEKEYHQVLGVHILGAEATELIAEATLGLEMEVTLEDFYYTSHAHPTLAEALMEAAGQALGKGIHL